MKKLVIISLISCIAGSAFAATVRIENNTPGTVYAQINNAQRQAFSETGEFISDVTIGLGPIGFTATTAALGTTAATRAIKKMPQTVAHYKKITPRSSTFFNSGFNKITKVNFMREVGTEQITMPKAEFADLLRRFLKEYGIYLKAKDNKNGTFTVTIPKIEAFTYHLGKDYIGPVTTESRIKLNSWGNAKRIEKKFLGIF